MQKQKTKLEKVWEEEDLGVVGIAPHLQPHLRPNSAYKSSMSLSPPSRSRHAPKPAHDTSTRLQLPPRVRPLSLRSALPVPLPLVRRQEEQGNGVVAKEEEEGAAQLMGQGVKTRRGSSSTTRDRPGEGWSASRLVDEWRRLGIH